MPRNQ
jgi:hypothetical protein